MVQPNYIQTNCKGYPGYSSYLTKGGNTAPRFVVDPLCIWRDVTARNVIGLYMHYWGVWAHAVELHPVWVVTHAGGTNDKKNICLRDLC